MRQSWALIAIGVGVLVVLSTALAVAAPNEHLDWGRQLHSGASSCPSGTLVINVVQKVVNDIDSGTNGNYWAYDDLVRQIQVVQTGPGTFCATVTYQGSFTTVAGYSPQAATTSGTVGDGVVGTFEGGYVATFTASLIDPATTKRKGSIGFYDYGCDATTGSCLAYVDWTTLYFTGVSGFDQPWWGWVYHGGNNGSWTNASTGNSGDIIGF